jgi:hypothetical protein
MALSGNKYLAVFEQADHAVNGTLGLGDRGGPIVARSMPAAERGSTRRSAGSTAFWLAHLK